MDEKQKAALALLLETTAMLVAGNFLELSGQLLAMRKDILGETPPVTKTGA